MHARVNLTEKTHLATARSNKVCHHMYLYSTICVTIQVVKDMC